MIILDLDNCISDDGWRIKYINWHREDLDGRWFPYHQLSGFDALANSDLLATKEQIIICTTRPVAFRPLTEEWLRRNGVQPVHLLMRNNNDRRASVSVKREQVEWLHTLYGVAPGSILHAYDDRTEVVHMYRSLGIPATRKTAHHHTYRRTA